MVHQDPPSCHGGINPPIPVLGLDGAGRLGSKSLPDASPNLANGPLPKKLTHFPDDWRLMPVVHRGQDSVILSQEFAYNIQVFSSAYQWLFAENVHAMLKGGPNQPRMRRGRRTDIHEVEHLTGQQRIQGCVPMGLRQVFLQFLPSCRTRISCGDNFNIRSL
jgi:hypothetical protein